MPKSKSSAKVVSEMSLDKGTENVFRDLGFPDEEADNLFARGALAIEIRKIILENGWSQRRAAKELETSQPRIAEVMNLKIDHYSIDLLVRYLNRLGRNVSFTVEKRNESA